MRTARELAPVITFLKNKGDMTSLAQADVLERRLTEKQVFETYVINVAEEHKDESLYYACRDTSRYLFEAFDITDIIPDYIETPIANNSDVVLSRDEFESLMSTLEQMNNRISQLERWTGKLRKPTRREPKPLPMGADMTDMMKQTQACEYLKVSKNTIKKYADRGTITAWQKGKYVYYSRMEIDAKITNKP